MVSGPQGPPPQPVQTTWHGVVRIEWVQAAALDEFAAAQSRLSQPLAAFSFFGGATLGTVPSLSGNHPAWITYLLVTEAVAAVAALIVWLARRPRLGRARAALGVNRIVQTQDYGSPPPTSRDGPPAVQDQIAQSTGGPEASINVLPTERGGPPPLAPDPGA